LTFKDAQINFKKNTICVILEAKSSLWVKLIFRNIKSRKHEMHEKYAW